jgi:ADP-ribose pyrophosphatase
MPLQPWKKLSEAILYTNPWWTYKRDEFQLPTGYKGEYHYTHTNGSAMIVPRMADGRVLTVKQYRYLGERESIEFPCGSVKAGATYDETARQELLEETGYTANSLVMVGAFNPYNGVTDEICQVYMAWDLRYVGSMPDETEEFELLPLSTQDIAAQIRSGAIWDGMTMAACRRAPWGYGQPLAELHRRARRAPRSSARAAHFQPGPATMCRRVSPGDGARRYSIWRRCGAWPRSSGPRGG